MIIGVALRILVAGLVLLCESGGLQALAVRDTQPAPHIIGAAIDGDIRIRFDRMLRTSSVDSRSAWVYGRWSGPANAAFRFENTDSTLVLSPSHSFSAGEQVTVILSHDLQAVDGSSLRSAGYTYQFWTTAQPTSMLFREAETILVRDPTRPTRSYGGIATNLNGDRFLDLAIVNEVSSDIRVFLNAADGRVHFGELMQPTNAVGTQASPSEPADFNRDGHGDICVANIAVNTVSVLLGRGDGTFALQQVIPVGAQPRGIAVLDIDGDGDLDIANTNFGSDNMSWLRNNGNGVFDSAIFFEGGGQGEWALAAADMDNDGILDLVVGAQVSRTIIVQHGNGNGTFTSLAPQMSGGQCWMLVCGDVNGDQREDVAVVNSRSNNGAILLGSPSGLLKPTVTPTDPFPLATDLGDLDGDGDLDWVTSSFEGNWFLFTNSGSGSYRFNRQFLAPQAASCALLFDADNDGDLDLGLIDELEDVVILHENSPVSTSVKRTNWSEFRQRFR